MFFLPVEVGRFWHNLDYFFLFCVCFLFRKKQKEGKKSCADKVCDWVHQELCRQSWVHLGLCLSYYYPKIQSFGDLIHALACTLKEHKVKKFNLPSQEEEPTPTMYQPWSRTVYQELSCALTNASIGCICPACSSQTNATGFGFDSERPINKHSA